MITEINGIKVKEVHTVQIEEVGSVYHFDIEFSDNENKYHHVTTDYMDNIIVVSSTGNILQFEFVGLERIYAEKVVARHRVYFNGVNVGIA